MPMRIHTFIFALLISIPSFAQESLLTRLNGEVAPLTRLEKLFVIKLAENKITEQLKMIATNPAIKTEGPIWMLKVASFSYGALSLVLEKDFPNVSLIYRERMELYANAVRGKLSMSELQNLEHVNDSQKKIALERELAATRKFEPDPNIDRLKVLSELGERVGAEIAAHAKVRSISPN